MCPEEINWNCPVIMCFANLEQSLFKRDRQIPRDAKEMLKREKVESFYIYKEENVSYMSEIIHLFELKMTNRNITVKVNIKLNP